MRWLVFTAHFMLPYLIHPKFHRKPGAAFAFHYWLKNWMNYGKLSLIRI